MNIAKVKEKLNHLPLLEIACQTRFIKIKSYKITPLAYVLAFLEMAESGFNTLEIWASKIARLTGHLISPQALQNRIQYPQLDFCKCLLVKAIDMQLHLQKCKLKCSGLLENFRQVYLEDSTCITLPRSAHKFFPGSVNQNGDNASARIQLRMELKTNCYEHIELQGYRDNDQKYAPNIISNISARDLVIRDLGYYVISVFKAIHQKGAYFLSRFGFNSGIYDEQSGDKINIAKHLRKLRKQQIHLWDQQVLLGREIKLPVRIVAIKAPQEVEQQRKRKANKDRRSRHSKDYMELLGWTILITNVEQNIWKPADAFKVYGFRWRIEIIFKCWKRNFNCKKLFRQKNSLSHPRILISFYLFLLALTLLFTNNYMIAMNAVYQKTGRILSFLKFGNYLRQKDCAFDLDLLDEKEILFLTRYYCQTKRKQLSHMEMIYIFNSS